VNVETRQVVDYSRQLHCFAAPSNGLHRVEQCQSTCGRHGPPRGGWGRPDQLFRRGLGRSGSRRRVPSTGGGVIPEPARQHVPRALRRVDLGAGEFWPFRPRDLVSGCRWGCRVGPGWTGRHHHGRHGRGGDNDPSHSDLVTRHLVQIFHPRLPCRPRPSPRGARALTAGTV
jgi:hypothetical protein